MENHRIEVLAQREKLCLKFLCMSLAQPVPNTETNAMLYNNMVAAEQERKLLQIKSRV